MKFTWRPDLLLELVRVAIPVAILFGLIQWTPEQSAGAFVVVSAVVAFFSASLTTANATLEQAGTSKTQVKAAAAANAEAGTPGGTGNAGTPGGAGGPDAPRGLGNFSDKGTRGLMLALALIPMAACAGKKPAVLVGQSAVITVDSIGTISDAVAALNLPPAQELKIQRVLFNANEKLAPLPGLIIAIDNATKAGETATTEVDKALAFLAEGAKYIDSLNGELKAIPTAAAVLKLVTEVQLAIARAQAIIEQVRAPTPKAELHSAVVFAN